MPARKRRSLRRRAAELTTGEANSRGKRPATYGAASRAGKCWRGSPVLDVVGPFAGAAVGALAYQSVRDADD